MAGTSETKFDSTLNRLTHFYGIDKSAVQKSKEGVLYRFTEIITSIINRIFGSDPVQKAETILQGRVAAMRAPDENDPIEAAFYTKINAMKNQYPALAEMLDQELSQIKELLNELQQQFTRERRQLEAAKKSRNTNDIQEHTTNIQEMANKFLEFEEGLKFINLTTDAILLPGLKLQILEKFDKIHKSTIFLNHQLSFDIQLINDIKELNNAVLILDQIENYSNQLEIYFGDQDQGLKDLGISQSVREGILKQQMNQWAEIVLSIKHPNQLSELKNLYEDVMRTWSGNELLAVVSSYVEKEYSTKILQMVQGIENDELKAVISDTAAELLKKAETQKDDFAKIEVLGSLEDEVLQNVQNFLSNQIESLEPALKEYGQGLRELGVRPDRIPQWLDEIKENLKKDINSLKDIPTANHLLEDINKTKEDKRLDLYLSRKRQDSLKNRQKEMKLATDLQAIRSKFPLPRIESILKFLGHHAKGSLLTKILEPLKLASEPHEEIAPREDAIIEINKVKEDDLIQELRTSIRTKAEEFGKKQSEDVQQFILKNQNNISNYSWLGKKEETTQVVESCIDLLTSIASPKIDDLDKQESVKSLLDYAETHLMNPDKIIQKNYKTKKAEATQVYGDWLEKQIYEKLKGALLPIYQQLTENADPASKEENLQIFDDFVRDKANEMKTVMMRNPNAEENYKDLSEFANSLKDELKGRFTSIFDYIKGFGSWLYS